MTDIHQLRWLTQPERLWRREEVIVRPSPIPKLRGIYGLFFREIPEGVPTTGCIEHDGFTLLYVGICPGKAKGNRPFSKRTIYDRLLDDHLTGNAEGSTVRKTVGILLADKTGYPLRCLASVKSPNKAKDKQRQTLTNIGEQTLDRWMNVNLGIVWKTLAEPWQLEDRLLHELSLPLNLAGNQHHPFHAELSAQRKTARDRAIAMDSVLDQTRRKA